MGSRLPSQFAVLEAAPSTRRKKQVMRREILDDGQGRIELIEQVKDQPDDLLDLLIRIEDELAGGS